MMISARAPVGNGMTPMRTVPRATRAKSGSRTRVGPEKPGMPEPPCSPCAPCGPGAASAARSPVVGRGGELMTELRSPCPRTVAVAEPAHRLDRTVVLIAPAELAPQAQDGVLHA